MLPLFDAKRLDSLIEDGRVDPEMLSVLATMPEHLQIAFIEAMVVKNPVGRPPSPKVTPQGLIEDVEQLKNHRARTIRSILSLQRELGYDGRQRRAQGTGTVFTSAGQRSTHALLGGFVEISTAGKRRRKKIRGKTKEEVERKMQPHMTGDAVDSEAENLRKLGARSITQLERNLQELWRAKQRQQMAPRFGGATRKAKKNNEEG